MTRSWIARGIVVIALATACGVALAATQPTEIDDQRGDKRFVAYAKKANTEPGPVPGPVPPLPIRPLPGDPGNGGGKTQGASLSDSGGAIPAGAAGPVIPRKDAIERSLKATAGRLR